ncbi:outer membrane beta-barrel protein [Prevotella aurantiaca]|jgi:hypothetical protein|uniref:Outer membrane beta-barrel protein n=1 Tax=Prevotella aurantiaca TaxID=596085 RepID=A0A930N0I7_9BACT|nr:outer membrane beta-barrel protein [Prevotella aurantiaca]MBF1385118.1 outer membrane beta-barrel protein [Prevotella aurantiaca]MBF1386042.1 outer membrane beta-barrel protein [Prevotella aurantiaca]
MKKILMTLAVAFVAVAANAQVYVGGSLGVASSEILGGDDVTTYQVLPEIGYNINNNWAIGTVLGWGKGKPVSIEKGKPVSIESETNNYVTFQPYARFTFAHSKFVNAFIDGIVGYTHYNHAHVGGSSYDQWTIGLKPGVAVNLSKKVSFVAHVGFAGWESLKAEKAEKDSHALGVSLDGNNVTFGVYYNF